MRRPVFSTRTLPGRLIAFSLVFVVLAMAIASLILWLIVAGVVREQIDQRLDVQIEGLRHAVSIDAEGGLSIDGALDGPPFDRPGSGWFWQVESGGQRIVSRSLSRPRPAPPPPGREALPPGPVPVAGDIDPQDQRLHVRRERMVIDGHDVAIAVSAPQAALTDPARRALLWLLAAMSVLGATLIGGIVLQVRYGLRPLKALTAEIAAIAAGNRTSLPPAGTSDLQPISDEINRLVDQNARRMNETRLHFANLAHSLKTPVASLSLALGRDNDPDGAMRQLVERIDRRIRHHLADARRTMAGAPPGAASTLKTHVDDILLIMTRVHARKGARVDCAVPAGLAVACSGEDLDEILGNLIDNAFKWTTSRVAITADRDSGFVTVTIGDDGPGIAQGNVAEALLPGVRLDETVPGDGFGLTIAKELSELYGGGIALQNRVGGGLDVVLRLPVAATPVL